MVFSARKQIFSQGDESDCLYILLSGRVKISSYSDAGKETVLAFMGENEVLGEMGLHARTAVGSQSLPLNAAVELEVMIALKG